MKKIQFDLPFTVLSFQKEKRLSENLDKIKEIKKTESELTGIFRRKKYKSQLEKSTVNSNE